MRGLIITASAAALLLGACTQSGTAEKQGAIGALAGAGVGAAAGQVIGGKPGVGAAVGATAGAAAGVAHGCGEAHDCFNRAKDNGRRYYDDRAGRYYYVDPQTGDTYWENGEFRGYGRR